jgi:two-component system, sensor histidine kinase
MLPENISPEARRLEVLRRYQILDTAPETEYDDIVRLAANICQVPIALLTFVDESRQWFKAHVGLAVEETPRSSSFCAHAIKTPEQEFFVVSDAQTDSRFAANPLVTGEPYIRFYVGTPLLSSEGEALGTLCVIDAKPRELAPGQYQALSVLRRHVSRALEMRRLSHEQQMVIEQLEATRLALMNARAEAEAASAAKTTFLATMSHEIRTPMNAVIGMTALLRDTPLTDEQTECVATIASSGKLLLAVVNDLLDLSKIEAGKLELEQTPFEVAGLVRDAFKMVDAKIAEKGLRAETKIGSSVPVAVRGDVTRLCQILVNLLSNAVKFTERGSVTVAVEARAIDSDQWELEFSVNDTGIGLSAEQIGRLFQPFGQAEVSTTRKFGGTGLGLAIGKKFAELHGGRMWVESELGQGSQFKFTAVAGRANPGAWNQVLSRSPFFSDTLADAHPCRLLVAEDNLVNQKVLDATLRRFGYHARMVSDGRQAVDAVRANEYDVVFMDVEMPELDGPGAAAEIRKALPREKQPVIVALTAHALHDAQSDARFADMDLCLTKPLDPNKLAALLASWRSLRAKAAK